MILGFRDSTGALKTFVVFTTDVIKELTGVGSASDNARILVLALSTTVKGLTVVFAAFLVLKIPFFLGLITKGVVALIASIKGLIVVQTTATGATAAFNAAMTGATTTTTAFRFALLSLPFGVIIGLVSSLTALLIDFFDNVDAGTAQINDNIQALNEQAQAFQRVEASLAELNAERERALDIGSIEGQIQVIEKTIGKLTAQSENLRVIRKNIEKAIPLDGFAVDFNTFREIKGLLGDNEEEIRDLVRQTARQVGGIERLAGQQLTEQDRIRTGITKFISENDNLERIIRGAKPEFTIRLIENAIKKLNSDIQGLTRETENNLKAQETNLKGLEFIFDSVGDKVNGLIGIFRNLQGAVKIEAGIEALRKENELLKLNANEREIALALIKFENIARKEGTKLTEQQILNIRGLIIQRQKDREAAEKQAEATRKLKEAFGEVRGEFDKIKSAGADFFSNLGKDIAGFIIPPFLQPQQPTDFGAIATDPMQNPLGLNPEQLEQLDLAGQTFDGLSAAILKYTENLATAADASLIFARLALEPLIAGVGTLTDAFIDQAIAGDISGKALAKAALESTSAVLKALAKEAAVQALIAAAKKDFDAAGKFAAAATLAGFGAIALGRAAASIDLPTREETEQRLGFGDTGFRDRGPFPTGGRAGVVSGRQELVIRFEGEPGGLADNTEFTDKFIETIAKRIGDGQRITRG